MTMIILHHFQYCTLMESFICMGINIESKVWTSLHYLEKLRVIMY